MATSERKIVPLLTYILIGVLLLNAVMYLQQPRMIYFPVSTLDSTPKDWGHEFEDVYLQTSDGIQLHGWFIPGPGARKTVLFFHGNAGNISHRRESIEIFLRLNLNVFIIDYRGYGKSQGKPNEKGTYADGDAAWDHLVNVRKIKPSDILIFGRSLGGAVATHLAARSRPAALIVESAFSSARDMASIVLPLLSYIVILRFNYDTAAIIKNVNCPVLVIHSKDDEIIPYRLGLKIYQSAKQPKSHLVLRGGHNDGFYVSGTDYTEGLQKFIAGYDLR